MNLYDLLYNNSIMAIVSMLLGGVIGSFANMLIYRLPNNISILSAHSICPQCSTPLKWSQLIPILSFISQKGQCSWCKHPISYRYLTVELLFIGLFLLCFYPGSLLHLNFKFLLFSSICIILFFTDLEHYTLPLPLNSVLILLGLYTAISENTFLQVGKSTLIIGGGLLLLRLIFNTLYKRETFGMGDIILLCAITINWDWKICVGSFYVAIILGGLYSCFLLLTKKKSRLDYIPFGPFIIFGFSLSYFALPILNRLFLY